MEEDLEDQEEDIWIIIFSSALSFEKISRLIIISITNLDMMVFYQETIYLE